MSNAWRLIEASCVILIIGLIGAHNAVAQAPNFIASSSWTDATVGEGLDAQWDPFVFGARPLGFQWLKDSESLLNSTNQSLLLTNVQFADAELYSLQATNAFGSITSPPVRLTVVPTLKLSRVGTITNAAWVYTVDIAGDLAYLGSDENGGGLRIVDVDDPANPALLGTLPLAGSNVYVAVSDIVVRGDRAYIAVSSYIASGVRGLRIVDISNPSQPQSIVHHPTSAAAIDLIIHEPLIYFATAEGIEILDTTDVYNIRTLASYASAPVYTLDFDGSMLYAAATSDGIHVIDVSDPTEPRPVSLIRPGYWFDTVKVANHRLYCTGSNGGPTVYDISNPEFPLRIATNVSAQSSHGMNVLGDLILDGRGDGGGRSPDNRRDTPDAFLRADLRVVESEDFSTILTTDQAALFRAPQGYRHLPLHQRHALTPTPQFAALQPSDPGSRLPKVEGMAALDRPSQSSAIPGGCWKVRASKCIHLMQRVCPLGMNQA